MKEPMQAEKFDLVPDSNYPKNIMIGLLYEILDLPNTFVVGSMDTKVKPDETTTHYITGYYDNMGDREKPEDCHVWLRALPLLIEHMGDNQYIQNLENTPFPVLDSSTGHAAVFGYVYKVDPLSFMDKPEQRKSFMEVCEGGSVRGVYLRVKKYYQELVNKQKVNEYK